MLPPLIRPAIALRHLPRPSACRRLVPVVLLFAVLGSLALVFGTLVDEPPSSLLGKSPTGRWTLGLPLRSIRSKSSKLSALSPTAAVLQGRKELGSDGLERWNLPDRLLPDEHYLVTGLIAGWTNQVMSAIHSIHLGLLTNRTTIIPYFHGYASQLGDTFVTAPVPNLAFGQVFDLPRLFAAMQPLNPRTLRGIVDVAELLEINRDSATGGRGWPTLHWPTPHVVVNASDAEPFGEGWRDDVNEVWALGCWRAHRGGLAYPLERIRIVPDFTRLPLDAMPHDPRLAVQYPIWSGLERYLGVRSDTTAIVDKALGSMNASERSAILRPSERVACVDSLYYTTSGPTQSLWNSWSTTALAKTTIDDMTLGEIPPPSRPAPPVIGLDAPGPWETVGQHAFWLPDLQEGGEALLRHVLAVPAGAPIPAFISVHIRRGDFLKRCSDPRESCFSLGAFRRAVEALRRRLLAERSIWVDAVVLATDETDPTFLAAAEALGWRRVSEEASLAVRRERGDWYPMLLDNVILSMGKGLVGTADSTMSLLNGRRVETWNNGLAAYIDKSAPSA